MKAAVDAVIKMGGGLAAACDCDICSALSLPIAGLMSDLTGSSNLPEMINNFY